MKVTLDENPLKLEGKLPTIMLRPESEADQQLLDTLVEKYSVYFGRHPESMRTMYVTITLEEKTE